MQAKLAGGSKKLLAQPGEQISLSPDSKQARQGENVGLQSRCLWDPNKINWLLSLLPVWASYSLPG